MIVPAPLPATLAERIAAVRAREAALVAGWPPPAGEMFANYLTYPRGDQR